MTMTSQKGFTLIELAIALMVIGLLIGGVLKGQELIENARITATIRQLKAYDTAIMIFKNTYGALPGDIRNPGTRLPNCTAALCNSTGNGDGQIPDATTEFYNVFPHLSVAGMIQGPTGGTVAPASAADCEKFYPVLPHGFSVGMLYGTGMFAEGAMTYTTRVSNCVGSYMPRILSQIDRKMDDGMPLVGDVRAQGVCTETISGVEYYDEDGTTGCRLFAKTGF